MSVKTILMAAASAALFSTSALAADIMVHDAYARSAGKMAKAGAAFMQIMNSADTDDRLVAARSDVAAKVELHTHIQDANGVMRMVEVEDGIAVPAGGKAMLQRGGDHVMFMGIKAPFEQGEELAVTLVFENAGEIDVMIPVDLERKGTHGGHGQMNHGEMKHGQMKHGQMQNGQMKTDD